MLFDPCCLFCPSVEWVRREERVVHPRLYNHSQMPSALFVVRRTFPHAINLDHAVHHVRCLAISAGAGNTPACSLPAFVGMQGRSACFPTTAPVLVCESPTTLPLLPSRRRCCNDLGVVRQITTGTIRASRSTTRSPSPSWTFFTALTRGHSWESSTTAVRGPDSSGINDESISSAALRFLGRPDGASDRSKDTTVVLCRSADALNSLFPKHPGDRSK